MLSGEPLVRPVPLYGWGVAESSRAAGVDAAGHRFGPGESFVFGEAFVEMSVIASQEDPEPSVAQFGQCSFD
jgi:hypothetical protein